MGDWEAPTAAERAGPSNDERAVVAGLCGPGSRVVRCRRLVGGITSAVHQLTVEDGHGARHQLVVRRLLWGGWADAAAAIAAEAAVLELVAATPVPGPEVVHAAPDGLFDGAPPAIVTRRAPGRCELAPADLDAWLAQLAAVAASIHDLPIVAPTPFVPWLDPALLRVPDGAVRPDVWQAAIEAVTAGPPPSTRTTFIHRDYQHFNLLWRYGRISTVVDWGSATNGPAAIDVGHCRLNLAVLFGPEVADDFLRRYEALTGTAVDPWWDLQELLAFGEGWPRFIPLQVAGRAPLDVGGMVGGVERVVAAALDRL